MSRSRGESSMANQELNQTIDRLRRELYEKELSMRQMSKTITSLVKQREDDERSMRQMSEAARALVDRQKTDEAIIERLRDDVAEYDRTCKRLEKELKRWGSTVKKAEEVKPKGRKG
ncbi:hypothetical protein BKA81DRAFT_411429 [Phyllosticta paracitricarpa]